MAASGVVLPPTFFQRGGGLPARTSPRRSSGASSEPPVAHARARRRGRLRGGRAGGGRRHASTTSTRRSYPNIRVTVITGKPVSRPPTLREAGLPVSGLQATNLGATKSVVLADRPLAVDDRAAARRRRRRRTGVRRGDAAVRPGRRDRCRQARDPDRRLLLRPATPQTALRGVRVEAVEGTALWDGVTLGGAHARRRAGHGAARSCCSRTATTRGAPRPSRRRADAARAAHVTVYVIGIEGAAVLARPAPRPRAVRPAGATSARTQRASSAARTPRSRRHSGAPGSWTTPPRSAPASTPRWPWPPTAATATQTLELAGELLVGTVDLAAAAERDPRLPTRHAGDRARRRPRRAPRRRLRLLGRARAAGSSGASRRTSATRRVAAEAGEGPLGPARVAVLRHGGRVLERPALDEAPADARAGRRADAHGRVRLRDRRRRARRPDRVDGPPALGVSRLPRPARRRRRADRLAPHEGKRRERAFEDQLPDVLVALAATLKAGHSFRQALKTVADEGRPPASKELTAC